MPTQAALYSLRDVVALARGAYMSTTYKPALLKAIVRIVAREPASKIALTAIGSEFTKLYWNQTVVFHLRQADVVSKEPEVLREIRSTSQLHNVRDLTRLPPTARSDIERWMARILKIDVLWRFHASKPSNMPDLFTWKSGDDFITIPAPALGFLTDQNKALETLANYWWARKLERVKLLAPRIIDKVERDGARRGSLLKYLKILGQVDDQQCFYCNCDLAMSRRVEVDHVLPWTFLLADPIWDLVLSCSACNAAKSDRLPDRPFVDKLITANERRFKASLPRGISPSFSADEIFRIYDAAISVEWPGFWSPAKIA